MSSQKGARSKLADVLADIKNSRVEDEYDYNNHDVAPTPAKRRLAVNYVALSGLTPRQSRSTTANTSSTSQSNLSEPKTTQATSIDPTTPKTRTYVLKLFDRTVDLAQFSGENSRREDTPLYPMCRAWIHSHRKGQVQIKSPNKQTTKNEKANGSANTNQQDASSEVVTEVYCLPSPKPKSDTIKRFKLNPDNGDTDVRIPQSVRDFKAPGNVEETIDKSIHSMDHHECMELNKQRWKKVKRDWSEARKMHESRYEDSFKILHDMFMSSQRGV